jgi:hypothetical protein
MNGKKAKLARRIVYGDEHHKESRKYGAKKLADVDIKIPDEDNEGEFKVITVPRYMVVSNVERQQYQKLKRIAKGVTIVPTARVKR